jgi:hypothetical protein
VLAIFAGYAKQVARPFSGKSSKYSDVYWEQESKMWHARLNYNGKSISCGRFHSEIDAAIAVNTKCSELGLPLKNTDVQGYNLAPRHGFKKTSQYKHVNWDRSSKKWRAQMSIHGKQTYIGLYESERDAAIAVNDKCQELGLPLRNQILDFNQSTMDITQKPFFRYSSDDRKDADGIFKNQRVNVPENGKVPENGYSRYNCVFWDHQNHVWYGLIRYGGQDMHCGYFESELEAAKAINAKCRELGIALKNPRLDDTTKLRESQFDCVFWDDNAKVWTAKFEFRGMMQNLGNFTSQLEAAKAVNLKCEQYGIALKNPSVKAEMNNHSSDSNNNHSKMSISNGSNGNNHSSNHSSENNHSSSNNHSSNNSHPSNGTNGQSNGTNGQSSNSNGTLNGHNGHENGQHSNGTNGNGQSNHSNGNGQSINVTNGASVLSNEKVIEGDGLSITIGVVRLTVSVGSVRMLSVLMSIMI